MAGPLLYDSGHYFDLPPRRFTIEDPIGLAGGINLYGYAEGDPVTYSDPFGLCTPFPQCIQRAYDQLVESSINTAVGVLGTIGEVTGVSGLMRAFSGEDAAGNKLGTGSRLASGGMAVLGAIPGGREGSVGAKIARGHAFGKHVLQRGEFAGLGIRTVDQFGGFIDDVMAKASGNNVRALRNGRTAFWDDATGTVIIHNPRAADAGTAFRPDAGRRYFEGLQ